MQFTIGNHTSIGKVRTANEDAFGNWMTPNGHLFVVCDGMGGHIGGAIASQSAVSAIYQTIASQRFPSADLAISQALSNANVQLHRLVQEKPDLYNMGTTAVVVLLQDANAYIGHIGDSRIYLYRNQQLHRLTKDHSFVQTLVDQGHITEDEAEKHHRKNEIYRAIGITDVIEPTIPTKPVIIQEGDQLLLCTDGVNGMIGDRGIVSVLSNPNFSAQQAAEVLIAEADNAGGHDNSTVQILRWSTTSAAVPPVVPPAPKAATPPPVAPVPPPVKAAPAATPVSTDNNAETVREQKKKPIGFIAGGLLAIGALAFVGYNSMKPDPQPKLGMETATADTATPVPQPAVVTDSVAEKPADTVAPSPSPAAAPKPKTEKPKAVAPARSSGTDSAKAEAPKAPVAKPKTDTVKKVSAAPKPAAPKPTTAAAKTAAPKRDTAAKKQPKAVMGNAATKP